MGYFLECLHESTLSGRVSIAHKCYLFVIEASVFTIAQRRRQV